MARSFGATESVQRHLRLKQRQRVFDEATYVESFLVSNALGGDCLDDFDRLRALAQVNQDLVEAVARRAAEQKIATLDVDATAMWELGWSCWGSPSGPWRRCPRRSRNGNSAGTRPAMNRRF